MSEQSRFIIGVDLGTTNIAVSYIDTQDAPEAVQGFAIDQLVKAGEVEAADLLPSFLYLPGEGEIDRSQLALPWAKSRDFAVGRFARDHGATVPTRLISSAKSWLCHSRVDRQGPILPWAAEDEFPKLSPVEASQRLLEHVRDAWNHAFKEKSSRLEHQEIILTVPASFDAVARELTLESARRAGLERITLFEEPQAAFYAWLGQTGDDWRKRVRPGDVILVVDVGGGTSDFTIIAVKDEDGELGLERIAVGDHLLLGGDNMDLALAHRAAETLKQANTKVDRVQMLGLWHAARQAKEKVLSDPKLEAAPLTVLGRGRKVIGGTLKTELDRKTIESVLVDGFFPEVPLGEMPAEQVGIGLQELGLPYVADAGITKHLSAFLKRHEEQIKSHRGSNTGCPNIVLFNGGVFQAEQLRQRVAKVLASWSSEAVEELTTDSLDRSVASGAAYFGMARRGKGVRIRGGVARSYYIGIESSMPAVPGMPRPIRAICVVPQGTEEGTELELPKMPLGLVVGQEVEFKFLGSTTRPDDHIGAIIDDWQDDISELAPIQTTIEPKKGQSAGQTVPVVLHGKVTEVGTLELWCQPPDSKDRWKLEYNVREVE